MSLFLFIRRSPRAAVVRQRSARVFRVAALAGLLALALVGVPSASGTEPGADRVVHRFDFDERDDGNLEDIPKFWMPLRTDGFPRFADGAFDFDVGHQAAPSFHLACNGRNVAYQYAGPETRVRANSEYRIVGYIRPDHLDHARAALSVHFLDKRGRPILESMVRSPFIGGPGATDRWVKVELYLPAAPLEAYTVGLMAWVVQEPNWSGVTPARRHIPWRDVAGGAWFDDLSIHALPRVELRSTGAGNVLSAEGPQGLELIVADDYDSGLTATLTIRAADGGLVESHAVPVQVATLVDPVRVDVGHLSPGSYRATLEVFAASNRLVTRRLRFAKLAPPVRSSSRLAKPFGIVMDARSRSDPASELALLTHSAARSAKLPVWSGLAEADPTHRQRRATDQLRQELVKRGFVLTGVFAGPPAPIVRRDGRYPRGLLELLNDEPQVWEEYLAAVVAPYASVFRWWQIGADDDGTPLQKEQLATAVSQLREAMRRLITMPRLTLPTSVGVEPGQDKHAVEQLGVSFDPFLQPSWMESPIDSFKKLGYQRLSAVVPPLPAGRYHRLPRLADWARRVLSARHLGMDVVYVPQLWRNRETCHGMVTEPSETYVVFRTIAEMISDARPGPRLRIAPNVTCLAFYLEDRTVLALWDDHAPAEGIPYAVQLGRADRQVDLWGRATTLGRDEHGRQIVRLSPTPVFVDGVERWLVEFRTAVKMEPNYVDTGTELARHRLQFTHRGAQPIAGSIYLDAPDSWGVTPRNQSFHLMPKRTEHLSVKIQYPHNEPAGPAEVTAKITLSENGYYLEIPLWVELGLTGVEVSGLAAIEGGDLVLQHLITNHTQHVLHFRSAASVPGRQRQYRPVVNLRPGDTQIVSYRFSKGSQLAGSRVRLGLREMNDGPRRHALELRVP